MLKDLTGSEESKMVAIKIRYTNTSAYRRDKNDISKSILLRICQYCLHYVIINVIYIYIIYII